MDSRQEFIDTPKEPHQCFEYTTNHTRCTETAMLGDYFCHQHRVKPSPIYVYPKDNFEIPELLDRDSIQQACSTVAERIARNSLDAKRAGHLLFAIQVAATNLDARERLARDSVRALSSSEPALDNSSPQPQSNDDNA